MAKVLVIRHSTHGHAHYQGRYVAETAKKLFG